MNSKSVLAASFWLSFGLLCCVPTRGFGQNAISTGTKAGFRMYYPNSNDWWLDPSQGRFDIRMNGGAPFASINSSGYLGLGAPPSYPFDVSAVGFTQARFWRSDSGGAQILLRATGQGQDANEKTIRTQFGDLFLGKITDNEGTYTNQFTIDINGNVGIGTTAPSYPLDVNGIVRQFGSIPNAAVYLGAAGGAQMPLLVDDRRGSGVSLVVSTNGAVSGASFVVTANGNVGVGTTNPGTAAEIVGGGAAMLSVTGSATSTRRSDINFVSMSGGTRQGEFAIGTDFLQNNSHNFYIYDSQATQRLVIDAAGNVGIGTTSPAGRLDVAGSVNASRLCINTDCRTGWASVSGVTGGGGANYVPKFTAPSAIGNSAIYDSGAGVGIGTTNPRSALDIENGGVLTSSGIATTAGNAGLFVSTSIFISGTAQAASAVQAANLTALPGAGNGLSISAQNDPGFNFGGNVIVSAGSNGAGAQGSQIVVGGAGRASGSSDDGGYITLQAGKAGDSNAVGAGLSGTIKLIAGNETTAFCNGCQAGNIVLQAGNANSANLPGSVYLNPGSAAGTGSVFIGNNAPLLASGNVGIGTTSPGAMLDVENSGPNVFTVNGSTLVVSAGSVAVGRAGRIQSEIFTAAQTKTTGGQFAQYPILLVADKSAVAADIGGSLGFAGIYTGAAGYTTFGLIEGNKENGVDGNYSTYMRFFTRKQGFDLSERLRIDSSGNVGIGTTSPAAKLNVNGNILAAGDISGATINGGAPLMNPMPGTLNINATPALATNQPGIQVSTNFFVTGGGSVGIGTTNPGANLQVANGAVITGTGFAHTTLGLELAIESSAGAIRPINRTGGGVTRLPLTFDALNYHFDMTGSEKVTIDGNGNVGIGTTNPQYPLDVVAAAGATAGTAQILESPATNTPSYTRYSNPGLTGYGLVGIEGSAGGKIITGDTPYAMAISAGVGVPLQLGYNNGTGVAMTINSSGYVGIGTTAPYSLLDVRVGANQNWVTKTQGGNASFQAFNDAGAAFVTGAIEASPLVLNSVSGGNVVAPNSLVGIGTSAPATNLDVRGAIRTNSELELDADGSNITNTQGTERIIWTNRGPGGDILIKTASTERLRVANGGNVGIGTTSPSAKLHVGHGSTVVADIGAIFLQSGDGAGNARDWKLYSVGTPGSFGIRDMGYNNSGGGMNYDALTIQYGSGYVGIGTTSPASLLSVGIGSPFQVSSSGDLAQISGVPYAWPGANAAGALTNNGSGALSWAVGSAGVLVASAAVGGLPTTTFNGLNGNAETDGWRIVIDGVINGTDGIFSYVQPNGDTTNDYTGGCFEDYSQSTIRQAWAASSGMGFHRQGITGNNSVHIVVWMGTAVASGKYRAMHSEDGWVSNDNNIYFGWNTCGGAWRDTTSNIISLKFVWASSFTGTVAVWHD